MSLLDPALRVGDLMHEGVITCRRDAPLGDVAMLLVRHRVHAIFVADDVEPIGVISDTDLLVGEWLAGDEEGMRTMRETRAADIMSAPVDAIDADVSAREAAERFGHGQLGRLLVRRGDRAVGVISLSDVVAAMARPPSRRRCVADVMTRAIVICSADTDLADVARAMTERRTRSVVVINDAARPVGVVTGHDLVRNAESGATEAHRPVSAVMSPVLLAVTPDTPLSEAADTMLEEEVHRLLVTDERDARRVVGIVSTWDLVAEMAHATDWRT